MAELTFIAFHHGQSLLHRLDVRFKMISMAILSISSLNAGFPGLVFFTIVLSCLARNTGLGFYTIFRELRYFSFLLLLILVARGLTEPGIPIFSFSMFTVSRQGLIEGSIICWRLLLMVLMGTLLVVTSRPSAIRNGVQWLLAPVPFIPEKKIAIMIGLTVRFVPMILDQIKGTTDAQRARGVENRKNPFYRIIKLIIPLMRRIFLDADQLILSMEARCYGEERTPIHFTATWRDWLCLSAVILSFFLSMVL